MGKTSQTSFADSCDPLGYLPSASREYRQSQTTLVVDLVLLSHSVINLQGLINICQFYVIEFDIM